VERAPGMKTSVRSTLWMAFGVLFIFVVLATTLNVYVLQSERRQQQRVGQVYEPLLESIMRMDANISAMLAAARAYTITRRIEFLDEYEQATREFEKTVAVSSDLAIQQRDRDLVNALRAHFAELKELSDRQIEQTDHGGPASDTMLEAARKRRWAYDFAGTFIDRERLSRDEQRSNLDNLRVFQTILLVVLSVAILFLAAFIIMRIERSLQLSIDKQIRRTQAMVAGMADGVMLVEADGRTAFINPAGERLLGTQDVGVRVEEQPRHYGLYDANRRLLEPSDIPAARALATGREVRDQEVRIERGNRPPIMVQMSAVPVKEDRRITGAIVTFRDITERLRLEEEMQLQAERAQTLADAGAFFASNIDLEWVTKAIAERVGEVLGDWAAVILRSADGPGLQVAAIHHRDIASLGLAWAFVYRQPLIVGEGMFGQAIATGVPSLVTNFETAGSEIAHPSYRYGQNLSSLLVLPLRIRGSFGGALVIAANTPERQMTEQKLPLAELLAERAALAIENAQLYIEQVEAREKVEDLSRLKDEFLSIASHELRTPVTSIKGYTQLAKAMIQENDQGTSQEYLDIALDQIDRMSRLILELLDVSRIETGRLEIRKEEIDWQKFLTAVIDRYRTSVRERRFDLDINGADVIVDGDRDRLEQVLGNLIENAIKYSSQSAAVEISSRREDGSVITSVRDHGIGIPPDEITQVFERFHRGRQVSSRNYGGLGLGLYITRQIVERHDGSIWVESAEGDGTVFHVRLPLSSETTSSANSSDTTATMAS
jgi:PAS domain S-box-containing protein